DFFQYDPAYRLTRFDAGARPHLAAGESLARSQALVLAAPLAATWAPGLFAREMTYSPLDVLQNAALINPDNLPVSPFAANYSTPDQLLHVPTIDGFTRLRDEVGNVTRALLAVRMPNRSGPQMVAATLEYNDLEQLTKINRDDGVTIVNVFSPAGLRIRRTVTGDPALCVPSDIAFIYDANNLIEERDLANGGAVRARYYYGDDTDEL